jgi:tetratricopeptide (TPR) repeat protein
VRQVVATAATEFALEDFNFAQDCAKKPRMSVMYRTHRAALALLAISSVAVGAFGATDEERATARSLANHGISAYKEKRYGDAADMFQRAESLVHSPVHLLYLGRSLAASGKLVRAQEAYLKATREELGSSSPAAFGKAVEDAGTELEALRPRVGQLLVTLNGLSEGEVAEVRVDGDPIPTAMVGVPIPTDPGQHRIEAKAPRHLPAWRKISLAEGQLEKVSLTLETDPDAAPASQPKTGAANVSEEATESSGTPSTTAPVASRDGNPIFLYTSLGALAIGLVGVGIGTYHVYLSQSASGDAEDLFSSCPRSIKQADARNCDLDTAAQIDAKDNLAKRERGKAIVPYVIGGVGMVLGTTLLVLYGTGGSSSSSAKASSPGLHVQPWFSYNSLGLAGTF